MENQSPNLTSTVPPVDIYSTPPPVIGPSTPQTPPPPPKKGFPKKILLIVAAVLILGGLGFLATKFLGQRTSSGEVTLTWWGLWEDESVAAPLIAEYEQAHPNVKITYVNQSQQDYRERLTNSIARGEGPDIFRFHNTWVSMFAKELDTMPASVMSAAEFAETFYPVASSDLTSGTGIVGIPLMYDGLTLFINEEIFESEGKTVPATWDDLRQVALELTTKDEQGVITRSGVALGRTENVDHWPEILGLMMLQNGVNLANPTGKLAEDALNFYTIFSTVDGVWDATLPPSTVAFAAGKVAMYFGPSWRAFEIRQQAPNLRFKAVVLPQLPKATPTESDTAYASYWVEGVWARSLNKTAAWDFLKFIAGKDSLQKMYQNASRLRQFGEPYPRVDMADLLSQDTILAPIIQQAPDARSWYLVSRTFDGPTGINSQITKYFEDAVNAVNSGVETSKALETTASGVSQILGQYGLTTQ
jgi:ABC-type glycerol-3-phosphate transport system substrate-binding protein